MAEAKKKKISAEFLEMAIEEKIEQKYGHIKDFNRRRSLEILFKKLMHKQTNSGLVTLKTMFNCMEILRNNPDWEKVLMYNERSEEVEMRNPPIPELGEKFFGQLEEHHLPWIISWMERNYGLSFTAENIFSAIKTLSIYLRRYDPLMIYFERLKWDGEPRIDKWLTRYIKAKDTEYESIVGAAWLISGVARTYQPGCKVDTILMLYGAQGSGKSTTIETMAVSKDFFSDDIGDLGNKDSKLALRGKFILEIAELESFNNKDMATIKKFATTKEDKYRPPYGKKEIAIPRRCIFAGSTNKNEFLKDETGARRFWPVKTGAMIDLEGLKRDRDQLWAEAVHRYKKGEEWKLCEKGIELATDEQESVRRKISFEDEIISFILSSDPIGSWFWDARNNRRRAVATGEVAKFLGISTDNFPKHLNTIIKVFDYLKLQRRSRERTTTTAKEVPKQVTPYIITDEFWDKYGHEGSAPVPDEYDGGEQIPF